MKICNRANGRYFNSQIKCFFLYISTEDSELFPTMSNEKQTKNLTNIVGKNIIGASKMVNILW